MPIRTCDRALLIVAILVASVPCAAQITNYRILARRGMQAPAYPTGVEFLNLSIGELTDEGKLKFSASMVDTGPAGTVYGAMYLASSLSDAVIIFDGDVVPQNIGPGESITGYIQFECLPTGTVRAHATLSGPNVNWQNDRVICVREGQQQFTCVAREGDPVMGLDPAEYIFSIDNGTLRVNEQGEYIYRVYILGGNDSRDAIYAGSSINPPTILVKSGDSVPGYPPEFQLISPEEEIFLNEQGTVVFWSAFRSIVTNVGSVGIFTVDSPGNVASVAIVGDPVPGLGVGINYGGFRFEETQLNDEGELWLNTYVLGPNVVEEADFVLMRYLNGSTTKIVRTGDPAPFIAEDVEFNFSVSPSLSNTGLCAWIAGFRGPSITSDNDGGIMKYDNGTVELVIRKGDALPNVMPPTTVTYISRPAINDLGQILFQVTTSDSRNIYCLADVDGAIYPIITKGQLIDIDPDPEVEELAQATGIGPVSLNNHGELAFAINAGGIPVIFLADSIVETGCTCTGDLSGDDRVNGNDLQGFISCILTPTSACECADINGDDSVNQIDIDGFVTLLTSEITDCP